MRGESLDRAAQLSKERDQIAFDKMLAARLVVVLAGGLLISFAPESKKQQNATCEEGSGLL